MAKFPINLDMSSDQIFEAMLPYVAFAARVLDPATRTEKDPSLTTDFVTNFIDGPLRMLTLCLETKKSLAEDAGINANEFEDIYRFPIAQQRALKLLQEKAQHQLCPPPSQEESPTSTNVNPQNVWENIETLSNQLKRIYDNGENDASEKVPENDAVLTEFSGHHLLDTKDSSDAIFLQDRQNRPILERLAQLYRQYDVATAHDSAISAVPETELKKRLKCWVGTKERFLTANSKFAGVLKKPESCSLLDKYFPQQQETPEDPTPDASANDPDATISGDNYVAPSPETEKSEKTFGSIRRLVQKGFTSAVNFGRTLVDTMKPAAKTLATAATALVGLMSHHLGPSSIPTTPHTSKIIAATSSEAAHGSATTTTTTTHEVAEPPAREARIRPLVRKKTSAHLPLKAKFDSPQPLVIEGENMRFLESTYKKACTYFNRENVKTWVCGLNIN
ncbi:MAG: hypothetical protein JNL76_05425 [Alphaproteobacteria bacterium]|nr:hypothetical protein [Alphaproteobacteria bacterium]